MLYIFLIGAFLLLLIGHLMKVNRWSQYIEVYENPDKRNLCKAIAISQGINILLPFRIGDLFRFALAGKKMHNGYSFSLATVLADLYIDFITVGCMMFGLSIIGKGGQYLKSVAHMYTLAFVIIVPLTILCIIYRKYIKKLIAILCGIFNKSIEFRLLYVSYLTIASLKDIIKHINKAKFIMFTIAMWISYVFSYVLLAEFLQGYGINLSTSMLFALLFSGNFLYKVVLDTGIVIAILMIVPSVACYGISYLYKQEVSHNESRKILPQLTKSDRMAFLKTYYSEDNKEHLDNYLEINKDAIVLQDNSAGSNASTVVIMKNQQMYFRKYAFDKDGEKLAEQIEWIEEHQKNIPLPSITSKRITDTFATYDMHNYIGAVGFFKYIHTSPIDYSWSVLEKALDDMRNGVHSLNVRSCNSSTIDEYINDKIFSNITVIQNDNKYIKALEKNDFIIVNGKALKTLSFYKLMFDREHLHRVFSNDSYSHLHGDLTIENIVCLLNNGDLDNREYEGKVLPVDYYFIDPNTGNVHESPFLDYAKLLQSLHGNYEFLMMVKNVEIAKNTVSYMMTKSEVYGQVYERYHKYLCENFSSQEVLSIYYHEIVHWLRLMPYKIRKDEKLSVVFYTGLLQVLNDVYEMESN